MKGLFRTEVLTSAAALCLLCLAMRPSSDAPGTGHGMASTINRDPNTRPSNTDTTFHQEVSWSPDGKRFSLSRLEIHREYRSSIGIMNRNGSDYVELAGGKGDRWTTWSPSGDRIAFASNRDDNTGIYVMNLQSSHTVLITDGIATNTHPDWSPDGSRIVFVSDREGQSDIYWMNATGSDVNRVAVTEEDDWNPRWSPDGSRIAYYGTAPSGEDSVYVMNADGSGRMTLAAGIWPSWSPDGSSLLYSFDGDVYSVSLETQEHSLFVEDAFFARWSPDGGEIGFIRSTWRAADGWPAISDVFVYDVVRNTETQITGAIDP